MMKIYGSVSQYFSIWGDGLVKTSVFSVSNHQYLPLYQIIEKLEYTSVWFQQKIIFQTLKALSISLKAFCKLVTSCCSLYGYFGAQRLLIGSRLWFSDTQHFTCTLLAFFIKQHFFLCFVLVFFLSQWFLISTEIKNFLYKEMILEMKYLKCYVMLHLTMLYILWNANNNILNMNSLFPFCPLHIAQLQYQ